MWRTSGVCAQPTTAMSVEGPGPTPSSSALVGSLRATVSRGMTAERRFGAPAHCSAGYPPAAFAASEDPVHEVGVVDVGLAGGRPAEEIAP